MRILNRIVKYLFGSTRYMPMSCYGSASFLKHCMVTKVCCGYRRDCAQASADALAKDGKFKHPDRQFIRTIIS